MSQGRLRPQNFTLTTSSGSQGFQGRLLVGAAHQRLADQDGVGAMILEALRMIARLDAAFSHKEDVFGNEGTQAKAGIEGDRKIL